MVDVFEEVEGELRSERYRQLGLKLVPWIIGGLVAGALVVGGIYAFITVKTKERDKASEIYAAAVQVLQTGDTQSADRQLATVPAGAKGYKSIALMLQGGIRLEDGKTKDAVTLFDKAADAAPKGASGLVLSDAARLKSALALLDDAPYADVEKRLKPLTEDDRPYAAQARETLAMAKIRAGKLKEARADLNTLSLMIKAPDAVRSRAKTTIAMIDSGLLANLPAVVKAAEALPPPPPPQMQNGAGLPPEIMQQLPPGVQVSGPGGPQ